MNILLGQDDPALCQRLEQEWAREGHWVRAVASGPEVLDAAQREAWDAIVIDATLPQLSGFEVVRQLRALAVPTPILFLSGFHDVSHRIRGLALGADDYLGKPFLLEELRARLCALHRRAQRSQPAAGATLKPGPWELDPLLREVRTRGERIGLQPREWSLFQLFLQHEGETLSKGYILEQAWGLRFDPGTNVVDAIVCRLRRKLDIPGHPSHIETLRGQGYRFVSRQPGPGPHPAKTPQPCPAHGSSPGHRSVSDPFPPNTPGSSGANPSMFLLEDTGPQI